MTEALIQADRVRLHACLTPEDYYNRTYDSPAVFNHHFLTAKHADFVRRWGPDFEVHIFYIPTQFDVFLVCEGDIREDPSAVDRRIETAYAQVRRIFEADDVPFVGGFVDSEKEFLAKLRLLAGADNRSASATKKLRSAKSDVENAAVSSNTPPENNSVFRGNADLVASFGYGFGQQSDGAAGLQSRVWLIACKFDLPDIWTEHTLETEFGYTVDPSGTARPRAAPPRGTFEHLHRRIEWFLNFYIDAVSNIVPDERWTIYLPIKFIGDSDPLLHAEQTVDPKNRINRTEGWANDAIAKVSELIGPSFFPTEFRPPKTADILQSTTTPCEILGIVTAYSFFSLPADRARISQFFVFPPHQRRQVGHQCLLSLYGLFTSDVRIKEVAVEDPAPAFKQLRDSVLLHMGLERRIFSRGALYCDSDISTIFGPRILDKAIEGRPDGFSEFDVASDSQWPGLKKVLFGEFKENPLAVSRLRLVLLLARILPQALADPVGWSQMQRLKTEPEPSLAKRGASTVMRVIRSLSVSPGKKEAGSLSDRKRGRSESIKVESESDAKGMEPSEKTSCFAESKGGELSQELLAWATDPAPEAAVKSVRVIVKRRLRLESLDYYCSFKSAAEAQQMLDQEWLEAFSSFVRVLKKTRRMYPLVSNPVAN